MNVESFLDYNQILKVKFEILGEKVSYIFECKANDRRLGNIIIRNLENMTSLEETEEHDVCRLSINDTIFINLNKVSGEIKCINKLTSFETRLLAQSKTKSVPFSRKNVVNFLPKTDLHTHFAGALTVDTLIEVGKKHNIGYPCKLLDKVGIDISKYNIDENGNVDIISIDDSDIEILKSHLLISPITQETFNKMEEVYELRGPFTKDKELFKDYLMALAEDYKKMGIEYVELSFSAFLTNPEFMKILEDNLPQIEKETGVKLRFLIGLWRHSDQEWNLDDIDRLRSIAKSPYIVGCDIMGHETNSTDKFKEELQTLAKYSMTEDPNFVIRVHAGENSMFKDNVKKALEIVYNQHELIEKENGKKYPMPRVRIGHGLYGVDKNVLAMAKEMGAIFEFNMSSNLALNNINSITDIPIKKYIDEGLEVVLSTDGHGIYSTFGEQEALLAIVAGLEPDDFEKIRITEQKVIERAIEREESHPRIKNVFGLYKSISYFTPSGKARYTREVEEKNKKKEQEALKILAKRMDSIGAITDESIIERDTKGKIPILITGSSKNSWDDIHPKHQEYISLEMQVLVNVLNPETAYIVTGGTNYGVEKTMHEAVYRRNQENSPIVLLGTLTMEATKEKNDGLEPNTITHATILEFNGKKANSWMELPNTQLEYVRARNGCMIAIGGGEVVSDMIQIGYNLNVDMYLMKGPFGASTQKSESLFGNAYSFEKIEELLRRLYQENPQLFISTFSFQNIGEYIEQAKNEILPEQLENNPANFGLGAIQMIDSEISYQDRVNGKRILERELKVQFNESEVEQNDPRL